MKYLNKNIKTIEELKKLYRSLAMELHPDRGGNEDNFKILVNEYESLLEDLQRETKQSKEANDLDAKYQNIIDALMKYEGLTIEVIGSWIWLSGNTYPAKETIKELGFKWAKQKKMWYLGEPAKKRYHKEQSIQDIKATYGTKATIKTKGNFKPVLN